MKTRITTTDGKTLFRVSRWIRVEYREVTKRHSLFDYADTYDMPEGYGSLTCFRHNGRLYAMGQFERLCYPIFYREKDGKEPFLSGYDCTQWYKPYLIEIDESCEYIRLYEEENEE